MATDDHQKGYSARAVARAYHIDRSDVLQAIRSGELTAYRRGKRRWLLFSGDVENWIKGHAVSGPDHARARVEKRLQDEERAGAG